VAGQKAQHLRPLVTLLHSSFFPTIPAWHRPLLICPLLTPKHPPPHLLLHSPLQPIRPGRLRHDSFCSWGPVAEGDVWQVMMRLNSMTLQLVDTYRHTWTQQQQQQRQQTLLLQPEIHHQHRRHQQQQQQQQQDLLHQQDQQQQQHQQQQQSSRSGVTWVTSGFLAVSSSRRRRVPGLQLNLTKHTRQQQQQQQQRPSVLFEDSHHPSSSVPATVAGTGTDTAAGAVDQWREQAAGAPSPPSAQCGTAIGSNTAPSSSSSTHYTSSHNITDKHGSSAAADALGSSAEPCDVTVITVSHFLPHPDLPHSRMSELGKAMGCLELQLQMQQVGGNCTGRQA